MKDTHQPWFKEAKYGLFIHFGLYSLLAGEYQGKKTDGLSEWIMNDLNIPVKDYEKLMNEFNPSKFDPDYIVSKAKSWGMRYLVFTAKHHDGFAMYDSSVSPYNIMHTPYGKDLLRELKNACDRQGMKMGFYYSQAQDWDDPNGYMARHDNSGKNFDQYLHGKCIPQLKELLTQYGDVALIWFDTPMMMTREQSLEVARLVKDIQPNCIVSGRIGNGIGEYMTSGDNMIPADPFPGDWEIPATINESWGYNKFDHNWKNPRRLLNNLIKINSRGGNYLLNIGPKADGTVPEESIRILDEVGQYVRDNRDSLFDTIKVPHYAYDIPQIMFTAKTGKLFIHVMEPIMRFRLCIHGISNKVQKVFVLSTGEEIPFWINKDFDGENLTLEFPDHLRDKDTYCIEVDYPEELPLFTPIRDRG
ncbi:MAG: alpha-L-fucosidase [Lachnospiraceae bacterium]|jgi:alpha-L-fucosidase|nr:alpha-L-fucosidase [Lachnospiraceae bacterium]MCH4032333.1 alpha-L-fucosidase [Lachnospiraceae bacterium]MCH4108789.1 alpha-L-fucosidase [Lachnospiraceae bacterium]MCI1302320.1 alpha-L-fucosidase [Lachnospiraceae bacterium]MCI1331486.1 alpha-L-fucosidase [Lachnospiraceae bacterium]